MAGRIDETHYSKLKERKLSDQSELGKFTDEQTTHIAVVSEPRGNISDITDEMWPELGMPQWALYKFLEKRSGYRTNSAVEDPHERAYSEMNLSAIYQKHLKESDEARARLHEAVERATSGENITLVCYEESGESCHRHMLVDIIRERVQSREDCKFKFKLSA